MSIYLFVACVYCIVCIMSIKKEMNKMVDGRTQIKFHLKPSWWEISVFFAGLELLSNPLKIHFNSSRVFQMRFSRWSWEWFRQISGKGDVKKQFTRTYPQTSPATSADIEEKVFFLPILGFLRRSKNITFSEKQEDPPDIIFE